MPQDTSLASLILLLIVAIAAHIVLLVISHRLNALFMLTAIYFILSPLSAGQALPLVGAMKWMRVYVTVLIVVVGFFFMRLYRLRPAAIALLMFAGIYGMAGLWSDVPIHALKFKGLYGLSVLGGVMLAYSLKDFRDLQLGMRILALSSTVFAAFVAIELIRNPSALSHLGRLAPWGINPNRIGQTAAPMLIATLFVALYDHAKFWKVLAYITVTLLAIVVLNTGSRGAAGEIIIGCFIVGMPLMRRPGVLAVVIALFTLIGYAITSTLEPIAAIERFGDVSMATREAPWTGALEHFRQSPVFGQGWVYTSTTTRTYSTANMHSIYLQILAETGLLGVAVMVVCLSYIAARAVRAYRIVRLYGGHIHWAYLAIGMSAAVLGHGVIESGTLMGSTINAVVLAMGVALFDRLPEMLHERSVSWSEAQPEEVDDDPQSYSVMIDETRHSGGYPTADPHSTERADA